MAKKLLILTLILIITIGFSALATPFHAELDSALTTNIQLQNVSLCNTFRIGAEGNNYSLDMAIAYNPKDYTNYEGIKGIGPSFSLDVFDVTFQLDGYMWPNEYAKASLKYHISKFINVGAFAQSNLNFNYDFGILIGIEM